MSYPGSKGQAGTFQRIIGQMPPHDLYVEPFAGSAQVFWRKRAASRTSILIDKDAAAIAHLRATVRNAQMRAGGSVLLLSQCGLQWLDSEGLNLIWSDAAVIYCDPPYLLSTRKGRRYYDHELSEDDHSTLLSTLLEVKAHVLISGYPSELYRTKLAAWRCISYRTRTRGRTVTECLWCNFAEPAALHDWRYAGRSFRERLGLKRLASAYCRRLAAFNPRKRGYLLNAIGEQFSKLATCK